MTLRRRDFPVFPYRKQTINAGSAVEVPYRSINSDLEPVELSSLRYRVDDLTNSVVVLDWTSVQSPDPVGSVTIPATLNGMNRPYRDRELRQVMFEMTDLNGNVRQDLAFYEVGNVFIGATS